MHTSTPLIEVKNLHTHFPVRQGVFQRRSAWCRAVDGVSFGIGQGETLGLVGESGCGKTTLGRTVLRLVQAWRGSVLLEGENVLTVSGRRLRTLRRKMQMVFQDPLGSLNPRMTVAQIVAEPLVVHRLGNGRKRLERVAVALQRVGLDATQGNRYPHEFSGGQRQRIGLARALILEPRFVVCDEPVSALDVSIRSQMVNLLGDLQRECRLTLLFISHDLAVVAHVSDWVAVMYLGRIVEIGPVAEITSRPRHPYTMTLLAATPQPDPNRREQGRAPTGEVPSPLEPPQGCAFHPRCFFATEECRRLIPTLTIHTGMATGHEVACHRGGESLTGE